MTTANTATIPKNTTPVHQWIRSAIRDSQQPTSPVGFLIPIFETSAGALCGTTGNYMHIYFHFNLPYQFIFINIYKHKHKNISYIRFIDVCQVCLVLLLRFNIRNKQQLMVNAASRDCRILTFSKKPCAIRAPPIEMHSACMSGCQDWWIPDW